MARVTRTRSGNQEELDHTPLRFGKYAGRTPSDVAEEDPQYIVYMAGSMDDPPFSDALIRDCERDLN